MKDMDENIRMTREALELHIKAAMQVGFDLAVEALQKHNGPLYNKKITPAMSSVEWATWLESKKTEIF